jgi:hypothetical protein
MKMKVLPLLFCFLVSVCAAQKFDNDMSNEGKGLFYGNVSLKKTQLKFVCKSLVPEKFKYPGFFTDATEGQIYLEESEKLISVKSCDAKLKDEAVNSTSGSFVRLAEYKGRRGFYSPTHHTFGDRLQFFKTKRPGFSAEKVIAKLNALGLMKNENVKTSGGGFNILYDRLFINDEDETKMLVIWCDKDKVYANYLSNQGTWQLAQPKIIHEDVTCTDQDGKKTKRTIDGATDKSTLITELSSSFYNGAYYICYSLSTWEGSPCFNMNLASVHIMKLNANLDAEQRLQIPSEISNEYRLFATDLQVQMLRNKNTFFAVIQSPNVGSDKIFLQSFNADLSPKTELLYLSAKAKMYPDLAALSLNDEGMFLSWKENNGDLTSVVTVNVAADGIPSVPVKVMSYKKGKFLSDMKTSVEGAELFYHFLVDENDEISYQKYSVSVPQFYVDLKSKLTPENWKSNVYIVEADELVKETDKEIAEKKLLSFKRTLSQSEYGTKERLLATDNELLIKKFTEIQQKSKKAYTISIYYDDYKVARYISAFLEQGKDGKGPETYAIYFDDEGKILIEMKTDAAGKVLYGKEARARKFADAFDLKHPYDEFQK